MADRRRRTEGAFILQDARPDSARQAESDRLTSRCRRHCRAGRRRTSDDIYGTPGFGAAGGGTGAAPALSAVPLLAVSAAI
jgi:hypothetical protein